MELTVFILLVIALVYTSFFLCHLLWKISKAESIMKNYYIGIAFFTACFLSARIIFLINDLIFMNELEHVQTYNTLYIMGNFLATIAVFGIMFAVEKYIYKKLKFIPSIIVVISSVLVIFPGMLNTDLIIYFTIGGSIIGVVIPFLYIYVGINASGEMKTRSFLIAIGLIIFMLSVLFYADVLQASVPIFMYLSPLMLILGLGTFHYALLIYGKSAAL